MVQVQCFAGGTYSVEGSLAGALSVEVFAPSKVPDRIVLGAMMRLEPPTFGVHAVAQERWQLASP